MKGMAGPVHSTGICFLWAGGGGLLLSSLVSALFLNFSSLSAGSQGKRSGVERQWPDQWLVTSCTSECYSQSSHHWLFLVSVARVAIDSSTPSVLLVLCGGVCVVLSPCRMSTENGPTALLLCHLLATIAAVALRIVMPAICFR